MVSASDGCGSRWLDGWMSVFLVRGGWSRGGVLWGEGFGKGVGRCGDLLGEWEMGDGMLDERMREASFQS